MPAMPELTPASQHEEQRSQSPPPPPTRTGAERATTKRCASARSAPNSSAARRIVHLDVLDVDDVHATRGGGAAAAANRARQTIRPSKNSRRRAIVLGVVQLIIVAHISLWMISQQLGWFGGRTLTPIEPSESMETLEHGVVNAGFIFFGLAILSTLIFGRFFCGWACHVVLLQDLCGWMMKKIGVTPRPFRSRLLVYAPLILALYMFVWPSFKRAAVFPSLDYLAVEKEVEWAAAVRGFLKPVAPWPEEGLRWTNDAGESTLTTADFWETFAGPIIAIPFLFICGFATVYFLGAKGFCTYGCPYGGFFAPIDKLALGRIVVNENCEQCGHCTAVCTSNVRVHDEVREYGMVVDPGCMKCMDCVSVCPTDALAFRFARPAALKGKPKTKAPRRLYDLTWPEEISLAAVFAITFFATRGLYNFVPMLMAVGIAGCATFILWKAWRTMGGGAERDRGSTAVGSGAATRTGTAHVRFHRTQLRRDGRMTPAGRVWALISLLLAVLIVDSGLVQYHRWRGDRNYAQINMPYEELFNPDLKLDFRTERAAALALAHYRKADTFREGGLALAPVSEVQLRIANLHLLRRELFDAERELRELIERFGPSDTLCAHLGQIMILNDRVQEAFIEWSNTLAIHPEFEQVRLKLTRLRELIERGPESEPGVNGGVNEPPAPGR